MGPAPKDFTKCLKTIQEKNDEFSFSPALQEAKDLQKMLEKKSKQPGFLFSTVISSGINREANQKLTKLNTTCKDIGSSKNTKRIK